MNRQSTPNTRSHRNSNCLMTNSFDSSVRKQQHSLLNSLKQARAKRLPPELFRQQLILPVDQGLPFVDHVQPWQLTDLQALDAAWQELAGWRRYKRSTIRRAYIERPRGHSKTSDMAMQIAWILLFAQRPLIGLAAAADRDQANFIHDSLRRLAKANLDRLGSLSFVQHEIRNRGNGSRLEVISSDVKSSYGALPDFVICDEVSHWEKPEMWYSLLSSAAKKPGCVLTILTNAGVGRGWQWEIREHARKHRSWYFSSLKGPQAPWITEDWLTEQRALLPEPVFERLWLNRWQHSDGNFVTLAEAEACRDEALSYQLEGQPGRVYVAAIDYAEKHDYTVGCVCHRDGERTVVDRMDVVKPTPGHPTRISWVEDWIEDVASRFHNVRFVLDDYQLLSTIQRLEGKFDIQRFQFQGGQGNQKLAMQLRQLVLHQNVAWYPGCGSVPGMHRDDLETELASLILRQSSNGRFRIDHLPDGQHHDDRAFALGVACLSLTEDSPVANFMCITPPTPGGLFGF